MIFAVLYQPGDAWDGAQHFHEQRGVHRHRDFLAAQLQAGTLVFGGPFLDDSGGLAVYTSDSLEAMESLIKSDPTVIDGLLRYEIHPYIIAFNNPAR